MTLTNNKVHDSNIARVSFQKLNNDLRLQTETSHQVSAAASATSERQERGSVLCVMFYVASRIVVHFNHVKIAAEYLL